MKRKIPSFEANNFKLWVSSPFETNYKKFYSCRLEPNLYYLQENISKKFEDICKIKSYLQI